MKRGKIIIIIIWILLLIGIFVYSKTKKEVIEPIEPEIVEKESLDKYEFIDYTGYFDENDLLVEEVKFDEENYSTYIKISGLKDKGLEERLNKELYDTAYSYINDGYNYVYSNSTINAFNILSVTISGSKDSSVKTVYRNIDLTTGNEIKISDTLNTKNIIKPITDTYYDAGAYTIQAEKRNAENKIEQYNYCIENNYRDCENIVSSNIDEIKQEILKYDRYMSELEDDALKYARNFDMNQDFYITSAGIIIQNVSFKDMHQRESLRILINDNPRLFNFYYKYKKDESIFDGSYTGKKNLIYSDFVRNATQNPPSTDILDYALVHKDFYNEEDEKIIESDSFKSYLESLDKSKFYYIDDFNTYNERIHIRQCPMTKDIYINEFKKSLADEMIKPRHSQGIYNVETENVVCEELNIYTGNKNVYSINSEGGEKIYIRNNFEKSNEINTYVTTKLEELNKDGSAYMNIDSVTESKIVIKIMHYKDNYNFREEIVETFDL